MTIGEWLAKAEKYLTERAVTEPRASAEFLMAEMLGVGRVTAVAQHARVLSDKESYRFWTWIKERGKRRPLAYILGYQPFLGIQIKVTRDS
ncbi:MAG: hypothetical protein HYZ74_06370, partial [Elusimicrobia bacterium]|nr:hypothetical protein [Elusimicrobiota bacterium]